MSISTTTTERRRRLETAWSGGDLPELTGLDRLMLRIGVRMILQAHRAALRAERAEQARRVAGRRAATVRRVFEHRVASGRTW